MLYTYFKKMFTLFRKSPLLRAVLLTGGAATLSASHSTHLTPSRSAPVFIRTQHYPLMIRPMGTDIFLPNTQVVMIDLTRSTLQTQITADALLESLPRK